MKYALLIYPGRSTEEYERMPEEERQSILGEYDALVRGARRLRRRATAAAGERDRPSGWRTARTLTTDGPFADTKEILGGLYLLEADDLDVALELAARIPAARMGGAVEVRPLVER